MPRRLMRNWPTTVGCARLRTLTISPSERPLGPECVMRRDGAVAVHRPARVVAPYVEIALHARNGAVGNQKPVSVAVNADAPGDEFAALRRGDVMQVRELDQFAAAGQAVDGGFDRGAVIALDAQFPEKMFEAGFPVRLLRRCGRAARNPSCLLHVKASTAVSREGIHWHNIDAMRFLLVLLPAFVLTAQAQTPGRR